MKTVSILSVNTKIVDNIATIVVPNRYHKQYTARVYGKNDQSFNTRAEAVTYIQSTSAKLLKNNDYRSLERLFDRRARMAVDTDYAYCD